MKALVILSAVAGKGSNGIRDAISQQFGRANIECEIRETARGDKPEEIVRSRRGEFDLVVAAGGDGTVSCAFDGLHGSSIPLGIIPTGTGNIVAREFKIPTDIDGAIALITGAHHLKKIDAMRIEDRVYVLNAGVGINAVVVARTTRKSKQRLGRLAYLATTLGMFRIRPRTMDITIDGITRTHRAVEVAISNCGTIARAVYPTGPDIRADDGHLDVWILEMEKVSDYVRYLVGIVFGRRPNAKFFTASRQVTIQSRRPLTAQADGDLIGNTPLEVEVLAEALTLVVPAESD
jgi:YegS/Rv2252/BmrU family lipid kinase